MNLASRDVSPWMSILFPGNATSLPLFHRNELTFAYIALDGVPWRDSSIRHPLLNSIYAK